MKHGDLGDEETTRSGLFMDAVRIIKEMRQEDARNGRSGITIRPRYGIYEDVPGALSSSGGDDWKAVLEELARIVDEGVTIPRPPKKWSTTGVIIGEGYSLAWRVMDAQYYGVPQRRRRIALVADFNGYTAAEIIFSKVEHHGSTERTDSEPSLGDIGGLTRPEIQTLSEGLPRHSQSSKPKRKEPSTDATRGFRADDCIGVDVYNTALTGDKACPLTAEGHSSTGTCPKVMTPYTLKIRSGCEGGGKGALVQTNKSATLATNNDQYLFQPIYPEAVVYALDRASFNQGKNAQYDFEISDKGVNSPLVAKGPGAVCYSFDPTASRDAGEYILEGVANPLLNGTCPGHKNAVCYSVDQGGGKSSCNVNEGQAPTLTCTHGGEPAVCYQGLKTRYIVRRLTPLECERLQGYPDGWTDIGDYIDSTGKKRQTSDAARYKALGNSIALPPWKFVLKRLCACYERDATMASLFDGIGGFPLLWEQINGKGSCLWASEIEEFPIAVTKLRIGGDT
jgi:DNA (cytosine-5)-methyltransferase 1